MNAPILEPWQKGPLPGYDPVISHLLRSSEQIREDVEHWFKGVPEEDLWKTDAGFHLKHLAGSTNRLCFFLAGKSLDPGHIAALNDEHTPSPGLLRDIDSALTNYEALVKTLAPDDFGKDVYVGRLRLKVTAISLAIHIAEHGQRHLGQAIQAFKTPAS